MHTSMLIPVFSILLQEEDKPNNYTFCSITHRESHLHREIGESADRPLAERPCGCRKCAPRKASIL